MRAGQLHQPLYPIAMPDVLVKHRRHARIVTGLASEPPAQVFRDVEVAE